VAEVSTSYDNKITIQFISFHECSSLQSVVHIVFNLTVTPSAIDQVLGCRKTLHS